MSELQSPRAFNSLVRCPSSVFTSNFGKLPVPLHLGKDKYFVHYIWENIHKIGKNKAIFGLGMPPVTGDKTGQIKSLPSYEIFHSLKKSS